MKRALSLTLAAVLVICAFALGAFSVSADTVNATGKLNFYAFEEPDEFKNAEKIDTPIPPTSAIYNTSDQDVITVIDNALGTVSEETRKASKGHAVVTLNGKAYTVENCWNGGGWYRFNIEKNGATVMSGISYTIKLDVYDENNNLVLTTGDYSVVSTFTSSSIKDTRTALNVDTDTSKLTEITVTDPVITGITPWSDGPVSNLFDGDTSKTKLGGNGISGSFDVTFKTAAATTVHYYTLYTGGDTATNANRNPIGWTLSGSNDGGNTWTVIDTVEASEEHITGLGATNSTPYTYKAASPAAYTNYKMTFKCASDSFQMNELVLFNDPNAGTTTPPTQGEDKPPVTPATGDIALVLSVIALIAVAGTVVIAKKRKIED